MMPIPQAAAGAPVLGGTMIGMIGTTHLQLVEPTAIAGRYHSEVTTFRLAPNCSGVCPEGAWSREPYPVEKETQQL